MSKLYIQLNGSVVELGYATSRNKGEDKERIDITAIEEGVCYKFATPVRRNDQKNKVLFSKRIEGGQVLVYSDVSFFYCRFAADTAKNDFYDLVGVRMRPLLVKLTRHKLYLVLVGLVLDNRNIGIEEQSITIDTVNTKRVTFPVFRTMPSIFTILRRGFKIVTFSTEQLANTEAPILSPINLTMKVGDLYHARYHIFKPNKLYDLRRPLFYYAPLTVVRKGAEKVLHVRRFSRGGLTLVRRNLLDVEKTIRFRFLESYAVSLILYTLGALVRRLSKKKVNIYFEKEAMKAEEGTFELFLKARDISKHSNNFYIINSGTKDYERIAHEQNVIPNFTLKAYWCIYRATAVISTEAPSHVNILRSNNRFLRKSLYTKPFIFLQHGITYMKSQTKNSAFMAGKEAEPAYMVVGSEKERDVCVDMLMLPEERFLVCGLPIYDLVEYGHINQSSDNVATVMLTWKPYEEHLEDFTKTTYYKNTVMIANKLYELLPKESVRIVAHPKVFESLSKTPLGSSLWKGKISEVLRDTKLMITDYSSVCYNTFYQGGGIIFYQPDLNEYELDNGTLIPRDNEYIGPRVYVEEELVAILNMIITEGSIVLTHLRSKQQKDNYAAINAYHDGKNIDRLIDQLRSMKML